MHATFRTIRGMRRALPGRSSTTNDRCEAGHGQITQWKKGTTRRFYEIAKRTERRPLANRASVQKHAAVEECKGR
jgi:hypothetical protein